MLNSHNGVMFNQVGLSGLDTCAELPMQSHFHSGLAGKDRHRC